MLGHSGTAVNGSSAQAGAFAIEGELRFDLDGQFAGRDQNQSARAALVAVRQFVENGQRKDGGFAAAGLRAGDEVPTAEGVGQGQSLDFGGGSVAGGVQILLDDVAQAKFGECLQSMLSFSSSVCDGGMPPVCL